MKNKNIYISKLSNSEVFNFVEMYDWVIGVKNIATLPYIIIGKNNEYINRLSDGSIHYNVLVMYQNSSYIATLIFTDFKIIFKSKDLPQEKFNDIYDRLILANMYFRKLMLNKLVKIPEYENKLMSFMIDERTEVIKFIQNNSNLKPNEIVERIYGNETYLFGSPIELAKNLSLTEINKNQYDVERFFNKKSTEEIYGKYVQLKFKLNEDSSNNQRIPE